MARQTYYSPREQRNPLYKTRMLQAGPIELDASAARLFRRLGVELLDEKPKAARTAAAPTADPDLPPEKPKRKRTRRKK